MPPIPLYVLSDVAIGTLFANIYPTATIPVYAFADEERKLCKNVRRLYQASLKKMNAVLCQR